MSQRPKQHYFSLEPSERAVFEAASRIYAAYIASGQRTEANKDKLMRLSIREAIQIGLVVEDRIQSDNELEDIT
jgi:hypothetical protein